MLDAINPLGGQPQVNGTSRKPAAAPAAGFQVPGTPDKDAGFPATPPPDALAELDKAARVLDELKQKQINLHFDVRGDKIHVQVRDGKGDVVREIPAASMLDVLAGDQSALAVK